MKTNPFESKVWWQQVLIDFWDHDFSRKELEYELSNNYTQGKEVLKNIPILALTKFLDELNEHYVKDVKAASIMGGECYDNSCRFISKDEPICMFKGNTCVKHNPHLFKRLNDYYEK